MIGVLARKELLDQISSIKFIVLFSVATILIVLSLYTGSAAYVAAREEHRATVALSRNEVESRQDYTEINRFGIKVARPPSVLSSVAAGVEPALGRSARVLPQGEPEYSPPAISETPILAVLGQLDLNTVVRVFLSLFALLLTYDAIAGEKENGTLKAVLANPVPRAQVLLGKALGLFGTLLVATLIPTVLGLLVMQLGFRIELSGASWLRFAAVGATFTLYLYTIFSVGLLVSTLTPRSSVAFLVLLLLWVAAVEVVPKLSPMIAGQLRPVPEFAALQSDRDRIRNELQQAQFKGMQAAMTLAGVMQPATSPADAERRQAMADSLMKHVRDSVDQERTRRTTALEEGYRNRQNGFTRLAVTLARLSPAVAMSHAVEVLSGTDFEADQRWRESLIGYREQLRSYLKARGVSFDTFVMRISTTNAGPRGGTSNFTFGGAGSGSPTRLDLASLPTYSPPADPFGVLFQRAMPDLVILALYATSAFLFAFARFLKYDVR